MVLNLTDTPPFKFRAHYSQLNSMKSQRPLPEDQEELAVLRQKPPDGDITVGINQGSLRWVCSMIYAKPCLHELLWEYPVQLRITIHCPWVLIRDFNAVSNASEVKGDFSNGWIMSCIVFLGIPYFQRDSWRTFLESFLIILLSCYGVKDL
ncbi:hypothetical protein RJT34_06705 [Clitoria ternatea]|uniref:Uncharacterized protein n=1 Tax=Clitoria ternatea TaxID=43366 RepID=A0AAN9K4E0_CLITE